MLLKISGKPETQKRPSGEPRSLMSSTGRPFQSFSLTKPHSAMKQIVINVADERVPLYRELVTQLGDKIASEKQVDGEHVDVFERARFALRIVFDEGLIKHKGDYAYINKLIDENRVKGLHMFESFKTFRLFLEQIGVEELPGCTTIDEAYKNIDGEFPNWTFNDTKDPGKTIRRINVARRFLSAFTKGK